MTIVWLKGPIPFGFDVDDDRALVPSQRVLGSTGRTEADVAAEILTRLAAGHSPEAEARRLNAAGVPAPRRYISQDEPTLGPWRASRLRKMAVHESYRGTIVDVETWDAAAARLTPHRAWRPRDDLLRGLVICGLCGGRLTGHDEPPRQDGSRRRVYVCAGLHGPSALGRICAGRAVDGDWLEAQVWRALGELGSPSREAVEHLVDHIRITPRLVTTNTLWADVVVRLRSREAVTLRYRYPQRRRLVRGAVLPTTGRPARRPSVTRTAPVSAPAGR